MSTREERAGARRETWDARVVHTGEPKQGLYAELSLAQRLGALVALNERAWLAAGLPLPPPVPRSEWPCEIFECGRRG
jgi:hypothetical protein